MSNADLAIDCTRQVARQKAPTHYQSAEISSALILRSEMRRNSFCRLSIASVAGRSGYCSEPRLAFNRTVVLRTGFTSNNVGMRLLRATFGSPRVAAWRTNLQTPVS